MLKGSQPLSDEVSKKMKLNNKEDSKAVSDGNIKSQRIGKMFDDIHMSRGKKISLVTRLKWRWRRYKDYFHDFRYTRRNHRKWRGTLRKIRPWEGYSGLVDVMITHLNDYIETEEKYGHSTEEYKRKKTTSARATVDLLIRMSEPDEYLSRRLEAVKAKYPDYMYLVTEYEGRGISFSGDFVAQGDGWVGQESGKNPRSGYYEFVDGRFELAASPDQQETDRLLKEWHQYNEERQAAYKQAEKDSDEDFERLTQLLKENMYSWWD